MPPPRLLSKIYLLRNSSEWGDSTVICFSHEGMIICSNPMKSIRKLGLPILRRQLLDVTRKLLNFQSAADLTVGFGLEGTLIPSIGDALHQDNVALQH